MFWAVSYVLGFFLVGFCCFVVKIEEQPFETVVHCRVLTRAKINKYVNEAGCIKAPLQIIRERLLPGEDELLGDLKVLVEHLLEKEGSVPDIVKKKITGP